MVFIVGVVIEVLDLVVVVVMGEFLGLFFGLVELIFILGVVILINVLFIFEKLVMDRMLFGFMLLVVMLMMLVLL